MKLSQLSTDQAADALVLLAPEIETLISDEALVEKFQNRKTSKDKGEAGRLGIITILGIAAYLLKNHRATTWNILGAVNGKQPDEIGRQPLVSTVAQIQEILRDDGFVGFFTPSEVSDPEQPSDT